MDANLIAFYLCSNLVSVTLEQVQIYVLQNFLGLTLKDLTLKV